MRGLALLLLLAGGVSAGEPFTRGSIAMMPGLAPEVRGRLHHLHAEEARRAAAGETGAWTRLRARALEAGLDAAQLARLVAMPRGPLREERYNHGVVLEAPALAPAQRALLTRLVTAADAAQRAALAQHEHLVRGMERDDVVRRRIEATYRRQRYELEHRFWRVAYWALAPAQMRAVRPLLSPRYAAIPELQRNLYLLPAMTPSQANRVRARFAEHESECAADRAEVRRLRTRLKERSLPGEERRALQRRNGEAYGRLHAREGRLHAALDALLTPAQRDVLAALPPVLGIGERIRAPFAPAEHARLRAAQAARVDALRKEAARARREIAQERQREQRALREAGVGAESPQMMTMEMAGQQAQGRMARLHRELGYRLVVEVLDPEQVADWVVAPTLSP